MWPRICVHPIFLSLFSRVYTGNMLDTKVPLSSQLTLKGPSGDSEGVTFNLAAWETSLFIVSFFSLHMPVISLPLCLCFFTLYPHFLFLLLPSGTLSLSPRCYTPTMFAAIYVGYSPCGPSSLRCIQINRAFILSDLSFGFSDLTRCQQSVEVCGLIIEN